MDANLPPFSAGASELLEDSPLGSRDSLQGPTNKPGTFSMFTPSAFVYPPPDVNSDAATDEEPSAFDDIELAYPKMPLAEDYQPNADVESQGPMPGQNVLTNDLSPSGSRLSQPPQNIVSATPTQNKRRTDETQIFDPTPQVWATGRAFDKPTVFHKLASMHIYGGLGSLTLLSCALHLCHVLPVASEPEMLKMLMEAIGEELINIHSSLNLWILASHVHWAVDTGLIKIVPDIQTMKAMRTYLQALYELRRRYHEQEIDLEQYHKALAEELKPRRVRFPPANWPYRVVGVLCAENYRISRLRVDDDFKEPEPQVLDDETSPCRFKVRIKPFDTPLRAVSCLQESSSKRSPAETFKYQNKHQKVHTNPDDDRKINPLNYDPREVFWLSQDPFFVLFNVGEFLAALSKRFEAKFRGEEFSIGAFVRDPDHVHLLTQALDLYNWIVSDETPAAPPKVGEEMNERDKRAHKRRSRAARTDPDTPSRPAGSRADAKSRASTRQMDTRSQAKGKKRKQDALTDGGSEGPRTRSRRGDEPLNGPYKPPTRGPGSRI
ncbi:hypothetical protein PM082_000459 [Marasmius tenuissimus]|nr:hypothetical protein PM082_000459 [Marasmius tenuissimus]